MQEHENATVDPDPEAYFAMDKVVLMNKMVVVAAVPDELNAFSMMSEK